jgi:hypothetical protein
VQGSSTSGVLHSPEGTIAFNKSFIAAISLGGKTADEVLIFKHKIAKIHHNDKLLVGRIWDFAVVKIQSY